MDLQTRKNDFVHEFLKLQSEELVAQFENLLKKKAKNKSPTFFRREQVIAENTDRRMWLLIPHRLATGRRGPGPSSAFCVSVCNFVLVKQEKLST